MRESRGAAQRFLLLFSNEQISGNSMAHIRKRNSTRNCTAHSRSSALAPGARHSVPGTQSPAPGARHSAFGARHPVPGASCCYLTRERAQEDRGSLCTPRCTQRSTITSVN
jgi:hypothetical protein